MRFLALVCLSLLALEGWSSYAARSAYLREANTSTVNMARALADHAEASIDRVDTILSGVVERVQYGGLRDDPARLRALLINMVHRTTSLQDLFLFDAQGHYLLTSLAAAAPGVDNSDRDYLVFHRTHAGRALHVGSAMLSRSSGAWVIPLSRRLEHPDGSFAGVALATIKLDFFRAFYDSFDIGQAGAIALASCDGRLIVRRPYSENTIGASVVGGPVSQLRREKGVTGSAILVSGIDQVERLFTYRQLQAYPLLVTVALSKDEVLARWRSSVYVSGAGTLLLIAMLLVLGARMIGQMIERDHLQRELRKAQRALEATNASLQLLALSDSLTGLANRRHFDQRLVLEFKRAMRAQSPLALVMIDVDYFKPFNDHYGHVAGDKCLQRVAKAVQDGQRRPGDVAARFGGEEFAILLPGTDLQGALAVAQAVRATIADAQLVHSGSPLGILTISAGVHASIPLRGQPLLAFLEAADRALYQAKAEGRNRVCSGASPAAQTPPAPAASPART